MMDFSGSAGAASNYDALPAGLLVFAILNVKGVKSTAKGGAYIDCELTVAEGQPYAGRKIFDMIGDPQNGGNSEAYRQMGTVAITRILECRGAGPNNPQGYQIASYDQLSGTKVGIKVSVEAGTGGHDDKNRVGEWLTPNPASGSGNKGWVKLVANDHGITAQPAAQPAQGGFGGFAGGAAAQPATGGFGNAGGGAAANSGFSQPAGHAAQNAEQQPGQSSTGFAGPATTSPSEPGATPGWLAQAGA